MNYSLINQLKYQAADYACKRNPGQDSYGRPWPAEAYEKDLTDKFVELIVAECSKVTLEHIGRVDLDWEMVFKERFGIK